MAKQRDFLMAAALVLISTLSAIGACEIFFRTALFSETFAVSTLRQAWRYADSSVDDDYWKLHFLFNENHQAPLAGRFDSTLGWSTEKTAQNPLGLQGTPPYLPGKDRRVILFYGDSFVAGITPLPQRIPQVLDRLLPQWDVLNLGVSGYGVDQIYLRFSQTVNEFANPLVLVGILTDDLDRSVLGIRTHQKPSFVVEHDRLVIRNTPVLPTTRGYVERNPPEIRSYFLRFVIFRLRPFIPREWFDFLFGYDKRHQQKLIINHRILRAFKDDSEALGIPLLVVIFYSGEEFDTPNWREEYLKQTLQAVGLKYFDTKVYLRSYFLNSRKTIHEFYDHDNGHLNAEGNRVVAEGLREWLKALNVLRPPATSRAR